MKRHEVQELIEETKRDLEAFSGAFDCVQRRISEREEEGSMEEFADWPGTKAVVNVLIMVRVRCEGLIEDLIKHASTLPPDLELVSKEKDQ